MMNRVFKYFFILILFLSSNALAQKEEYKDEKKYEEKKSKKKVKKKSKKSKKWSQSYYSSSKVQVVNYLDSAKAYRYTDVSKSYDFIEKALKVAIKNKSAIEQAKAYQLLGDINLSLKKYDDAIKNLKKSESISLKINDSNLSYKTHFLLGNAYLKKKNYNDALKYYFRFQSQADLQKKHQDVIKAKVQTAIVYEQQKKYSQAVNELKSAYNLAKKHGLDKDMSLVLSNQLADILVLQKKEDEALKIYQGNLDTSSTVSNNAALKSIEKILEKENKLDEILLNRQTNLQKNIANEDKKSQVEDYAKISEVYLQQNKWEKAIPVLEEKVKIAEELKDTAASAKGYKNLSRAYKGAGKDELALNSYEKYTVLVDKLEKKQKKRAKEAIALNEKISAKQREIDLLEKDKKLNEQELKLKDQEIEQQLIVTYSLIAVLLLVIVGSILLYRSSQQKKVANQLLALKSLRSQMNPHFIFNALNSVNSFIAINDEKAANKYLSDFSKLMRQVMENSKYDLVSLESELQILEKYLKLEHFRFSDKFEYSFEIDEGIDIEEVQIPPMLIQPYIENSVWHGLRYKETKGFLSVKLSEDKDNIICVIQDDGIGRKRSKELKTKNQKETKSTGMENIEHRLNIINDVNKMRLKVAIADLNTDGTGTIVTLKIPKTEI